jgi:hypothetical protein
MVYSLFMDDKHTIEKLEIQINRPQLELTKVVAIR